jgi:hypothetical protein
MDAADLDRAVERIWQNYRLSQTHEADQFLARLHDDVQAGRALGDQCVCGCARTDDAPGDEPSQPPAPERNG